MRTAKPEFRHVLDTLGALPLLHPEPYGGSEDEGVQRRARSVFISDLHLGTPGCQADAVLSFLKAYPSDYLYLVGDIVDGWQLRKRWYWPQAHNDVVQKLLRRARKGCRVIYVPGNHDEFARHFAGNRFGGVEVMEEAVHVTAGGRKLWVIHGDRFDAVVQCAKWLADLGDNLYEFTLRLNRHVNRMRARFGLPYWSLSAYLKHRVKKALNYVTDFEQAVAQEAARRGHGGVVCGHIHRAEMRDIGGVLYCNDGDWVESRTALVEHFDGSLEIVHLASPMRAIPCSSTPIPNWKPHEDCPGDRRLDPAGQRRRRHARRVDPRAGEHGMGGGGDPPASVSSTRPCPGYPGIDLAIAPGRGVTERLEACAPDVIHIATEGPLGWAARSYCLRAGLAFTTAFHTKFPEIVNAAIGVPVSWSYAVMRHFHGPSSGVMVPTASVLTMLRERGFRNLCEWTHGVDTETFAFSADARVFPRLGALRRPLSLFVGRVSYEKNIAAFLDLQVPGSKVVCGVGPLEASLRRKYPHVTFVGLLDRPTLATLYSAADVFVFPSFADTFGLVMVEAMACGTPVAAYRADGPKEVLGRRHPGDGSRSLGGAMDDDLQRAWFRALKVPRAEARYRALDYSWQYAAQRFTDFLVPAQGTRAQPAVARS